MSRIRVHPDTPEREVERAYKREYMREYRARNPKEAADRVRNSTLKAFYGINQAEYDALFERQGCRCAACKTTDNGKRRWSVDHDHETGRIRGILCLKCNTALGMLNDSPYLLTALLQYLVEAE